MIQEGDPCQLKPLTRESGGLNQTFFAVAIN
jgi:hypothetical protein